ncbi:hypothetical protein D918_04873 [Trichuris suis]|nr:hypothetical protein D918_04873 [Trichuris suis]
MEASVIDGVGASALAAVAGRSPSDDEITCSKALKFVYPYGCTLSLTKGACAQLLSSGSMCYPFNQSLCALFHSKSSGGRVLVIGSNLIFSDAFLDKEDNNLLLDALLTCIVDLDSRFDDVKLTDSEPMEYHVTPDSVAGSNEVKCCLQEAETKPLSEDIEHIFDSTLHSIDHRLWPDVIRAYEQLGIPHEPLTLIEPTFERIFPPLKPAVSGSHESVEHKSRTRLHTDTEDQLDTFVMKCAEILGITKHLKPGFQSPKNVLEFVSNQVMEFKKLNQTV